MRPSIPGVRASITAVVVSLLMVGCGDSAGPGQDGPVVSGVLVSCTRGERDAFSEAILDGELLSREELADLPEGAALVEFFATGPGGYEADLFLSVDGFVVRGSADHRR